MLDAEGLPAVELFILPEVALDGQGMVPEDRVIPLRDWLLGLAEEPAGRDGVVHEYGAALSTVEGALAGGTLLRGEILVRWREFVSNGEFHEAVVARSGRGRRLGAAVTGKAPPGGKLQGALAGGLVTLVAEAVAGAADRTRTTWAGAPA